MIVLETVAVQKNHKLILNNRKAGLVTGVLDVLSFNLNEILLETEQGMLMVRGTDLHVNRVNLEKGDIDYRMLHIENTTSEFLHTNLLS